MLLYVLLAAVLLPVLFVLYGPDKVRQRTAAAAAAS
jgi:hypothetical protein